MLMRWFLPLLYFVIGLYAGASQFWSRPQCLTHAQPLPAGRKVPPFRPRRPVAGPTPPRSRVWRLAIGGCFYGALALSLQDAASLVAGETMGWLRIMAPGSGAFLALSRAMEHPLTIAGRLGSQPDECFTRDDSDVDGDDFSPIPPLILRADFLPPALVGIDLNGSTHTCVWPTYYLVRPQLLTRL